MKKIIKHEVAIKCFVTSGGSVEYKACRECGTMVIEEIVEDEEVKLIEESKPLPLELVVLKKDKSSDNE